MTTRSLATIGTLVTILFTAGDEVAAATLYVSQTSTNPTAPYATWDTAANTIQEAVDAANDGDTVLVARPTTLSGQYDLTNQVAVGKAIVLRGENQPILHCRGTRCLWISNSLAVVEGFNIREGSDGGVLAGGVVMVGGTLSNCVVQTHSARQVYCSGGGLITDCQITIDRRFGGLDGTGVYLTNSQLRNSVISGISSRGYPTCPNGAGVYAIASSISGCTVASGHWAGQHGGAAYLDGCDVDRCTFSGTAGYSFGMAGRGGGIFAINSNIRNSRISGHASNGSDGTSDGVVPGLGGGVYLRGGSLLNCTVTGSAAAEGGGVYAESGTVRNSIIYFNTAYVTNANWSNIGGTFDHSCTTPDPGGAGNIVEDPQFIDRTNGNYRLAPTSPCIDVGVNEAWMAGAQDLDGNPRIINGTVDLGAWESPVNDTDGDSVPDERDRCPDTSAGAVVNAEGCSIPQLCPCEAPWQNHREYVLCVMHSAWEFYRQGLITADQRREITRAAAQSDCGKGQQHEAAFIHVCPQTAQECSREGIRAVVSGDISGPIIMESSTDLVNWSAVPVLQAAAVGEEILFPIGPEPGARFYRVRAAPAH